MVKKKKTKAIKPNQSLTPELQSALDSWLESTGQGAEQALINLTEAAQADPALALAMIQGLGRLESPEAGWLANRAGQVLESKSLRKEAKKALYRLEQKGVRVEEEQAPARPIFKAVKMESPFGYLSGYYPDHTQVLALAFPSGMGEAYCGAAVCHFEQGFMEVGLTTMRLAQFRKMNEQMGSDLPWPPVKIETPDLVWLLDSLIKRHRAAGSEGSQEVSFLAQWVEEQGGSPGPEYISQRTGLEPKSGPGYAKKLAGLLDQPPCLTWYPDEEKWSQVRDQDGQDSGSGLILSPELEAEQEDKALADMSARLFPVESYPAWQARLEETALVLHLSDRDEQAAIALGAAQDIDRPGHPLFLGLIRKTQKLERETADLTQEGLDVPESDGGLILPPGLDGGTS